MLSNVTIQELILRTQKLGEGSHQLTNMSGTSLPYEYSATPAVCLSPELRTSALTERAERDPRG